MPPSRLVPNWILLALLVTSLFGFADATYLSAKFFQGIAPPCALFSGCDAVATSKYAAIGPVPVAFLGVFFYLCTFVFTLLYQMRRGDRVLKVISLVTTLGFLFTLYLVYLQLFVIKAVCVYCMFSALSSTLIFILSSLAVRSHRSSVTE
jgi:uncharacterized membrane protein